MTLTTHIAIAGAIAKPLIAGGLGPVGLFITSAGTHYLADAVPHYDYKLRYFVDTSEGEVAPPFKLADFIVHDVFRVALDAALGIGLIFLVTQTVPTVSSLITWSPVILGAVLPDFLQALRFIIPGAILDRVQKLQDFAHGRKLGWSILSIASQVLILIGALGLSTLF